MIIVVNKGAPMTCSLHSLTKTDKFMSSLGDYSHGKNVEAVTNVRDLCSYQPPTANEPLAFNRQAKPPHKVLYKSTWLD